ncbi:hypothetical protein D3C73_1199110 [compost metagenome]
MPRQLRQHRVFLAGQRHFHTLEQHPAIGQVHRQRAEAERRLQGIPRWHLAQQCAHPGEKFLDTEWFGHVVIGTAIERFDFLPFAGAHRQHQHRHRGPLAKLAQHLLAVHVRQAEVEHQQIGFAERRLRQAFGAGASLQHLVALGGKADAQELADLRFVVDDEDGRGLAHGLRSRHGEFQRVSGFTAQPSSSSAGCSCNGRCRVMHVPRPSMPSATLIRPPWAPTMP